MSRLPTKQELHRQHQHLHLLQHRTTEDTVEVEKLQREGPVTWLSRTNLLASKADTQVWSPGPTWWKERVDSCKLWHTLAYSQTHKVPKEKGGTGGSRTPKPGKGFSGMWGSEATTQCIRALPHAEHTLQGKEPNMSAEAPSLHLTHRRQDAWNVYITFSRGTWGSV